MLYPALVKHHHHIDRTIGTWLDLHFGDHSYNGRVTLGIKRNGQMQTLAVRSLTDLKTYVLMMHTSDKCDYYITANTVSGTRRVLDGLFSLNNIVIDIDCHNPERVPALLIETFLWRAKRDVWGAAGLPCPNSIVKTGRGVQLWWAIKPCYKSYRTRYDEIKMGIVDRLNALLSEYSELDGLEIDNGPTKNAVGFYRLPCSYNTAAKKWGDLEIVRNAPYDLDNLSEYKHLTWQEKSAGIDAGTKADVILLQNEYTTGINRVMQITKLRDLRNNAIGTEKRNDLCFAVYNALRMSFNHDEAMERLAVFNAGFKLPMTEQELTHTLCSAIKKGGYKYTNAKLIEFLAITPEEQDAIGLHPYRGVFTGWAHCKPNANRDAERKARRDDRNNKIISMHQEGISQAETARTLGISRNTVARVLKDWRLTVPEEDPKEVQTIEQHDLAIAHNNLLNFGSIYERECLIQDSNDIVLDLHTGVAASLVGPPFARLRAGPSGDG